MAANDDTRLALRAKVEAGKQRLAERGIAIAADELADKADELSEKAESFIKKYPLALIAGALAIGVFIGSKRGSKKAKPSKVAKQGGVIGAMLAEAAIAYGLKLIEKASQTDSEEEEAA